MSKNLIPQIAPMLGVELFEEFKVVYKVGFEIICNFTKEGVFVHEEGCSGKHDKELLADIICGKAEIVKLPWKPKLNERYWTFMSSLEGGKLYVLNYMWDNSVIDVALHKVGWVFRTCEEAQAALPAVAKELGVEYKL